MITYSYQIFKSNIKESIFPGGEVYVKLQQPVPANGLVVVKANIKSSDDVMKLLMVADAIKRQSPKVELELDMPYIPYARQDRVCTEGESLSIAVFAKLINSVGFSQVHALDPHSDVASALINNIVIKDQVNIFRKVKQNWFETYIVAPDAGAYKKTYKFAEAVGAKGVITCNKVRDLSTGQVVGVSCNEDVRGKNLLVLDDICDGGRTFTELSSILRATAGKLELAVTHGIFSKGQKVVAEAYDRVYTTNSFHSISMECEVENITIINV